jgi:hypothetical protein
MHPNLEMKVTPPLDGHPAMVEALLGRAREAQDRDAQEKTHAGKVD